MKRIFVFMLVAVQLVLWQDAFGQGSARAVDIPTRPGVTQRFLLLTPENPKAYVLLFPGGDGGLELSQTGSMRYLNENFLVRTRHLFAEKGLSVAIIDAPSDRQRTALKGFRQMPEHVADIKAVIAWLKQQNNMPVWLVGTSNGTLSAAFAAIKLSAGPGGPDGLVLTSTILNSGNDKLRPVSEMPLEKIAIPVLVVHHEQDGCKFCPYNEIPNLMKKLTGTARKELITFRGGQSRGDPCQALAYHGFNGIEKDVVGKISDWIYSK